MGIACLMVLISLPLEQVHHCPVENASLEIAVLWVLFDSLDTLTVARVEALILEVEFGGESL